MLSVVALVLVWCGGIIAHPRRSGTRPPSGILVYVLFQSVYDILNSRRSIRAGSIGLVAALMATVVACGSGDAGPIPDVQAVIDDALARISATELAPTQTPDGSVQSMTRAGSTRADTTDVAPPVAPAGGRAGDSPPAVAPTPANSSPAATVAPTAVAESEVSLTIHDLDNGPYLLQQNPQSAVAISELPWIADGISQPELLGANELVDLAAVYPAVAGRVIGYGWVADGVTASEHNTVESLHAIAQRDEKSAQRIVAMPFLQTLDAADQVATLSLRQMAFRAPGTLHELLSHPTLSGGITDDWAKIVALLHGVNRTNPGLIDTLLDPSRITVEQHTITLPLSGQVDLAIIRTGSGAQRSMTLLESSVRNLEAFMAEPLPTNYVGLLFENAVKSSTAGTNFGTHIAILPEHDVDDGSQEANAAGHIIAHEVAHYYWGGNEDWIDEGAADFLASISERARTGKPLEATNHPCAVASSINALARFDTIRDPDAFNCNYALGERLFLDMYVSLGENRFRRGFGTLYQLSAVEDNGDDRDGTAVGINHLTAAFISPNDPGTVDRVVRRWYDGTVAHDTTQRDTRPADARLPSINGIIDAAYISISQYGPAVATFSASAVNSIVWLNLEYSYQLSSGNHELEVEVVEFYEDGFVANRLVSTLTADAKYIGGTQFFSVGPLPPSRWAPGRHWVYVYEGDRKVAEVEFEVTE